jgi:hypothetical protein
MSDNNKTVAMGQILGMGFAMQQASIDREMQNAASLELVSKSSTPICRCPK